MIIKKVFDKKEFSKSYYILKLTLAISIKILKVF